MDSNANIEVSASIIGTNMQAGTLNKVIAGQTVYFGARFQDTPVVIVSPYWRGGGEVGHVETITDVNVNSFTVTSGNAAENYFINWVAFGPL